MAGNHHPQEICDIIYDAVKSGAVREQLARDLSLPSTTVYNIYEREKRKRSESLSLADIRAKYCGRITDEIPPSLDKNPNTHSGETVLAIPDLHCPFEHPDALTFLLHVRDEVRPTRIVCLGDEVDFHAYSKWPKDPDGLGAGQELQAAIEHLIPFYRAFPDVQVCVSNHTIRPHKMMKAVGLPKAFFAHYSTMLNAPDGWSWHEHIIIDNVRYMHGDQGKGGQHGWTQNSGVYHQSVVVGHWHSKAGVYWDSGMFNVNAGCLIDDKAYAFDYARHSHKRPNLGCVIVRNGESAVFLPMLLNKEGRWIGRL